LSSLSLVYAFLYILITIFYTDSLTPYMLEGPGAIFTDGSELDLAASPARIDLRCLAPRLVTLVNSMDFFYVSYHSLSLSLSLALSSHSFQRAALS